MSTALSPEREKELDTLQTIFRRPFFLSFTIGIPFCIYKLLFGVTAIRIGAPGNLFLVVFGWIVVFWALGDLLINISRGILDLLHRPLSFEYCIIAEVGHYLQKPMLFLAIDTLLAFSIVCFMLWSYWIVRLTLFESYLWFFATTLNLISLSLANVYNEIVFYRAHRTSPS
jgi:hypothetical protein